MGKKLKFLIQLTKEKKWLVSAVSDTWTTDKSQAARLKLTEMSDAEIELIKKKYDLHDLESFEVYE